ncbi:MAG: phage tail protein I [Oscillospiraceae bacterium]
MNLSNISLIDLQPQSLRNDPVTIALCNAFQPVFLKLAEQIKLTMVYTNIDNVASNILDELAWGFNITWYNPNDYINIKRQMIKSALKIHSRKGTVSALRDALEASFGSSYIEEWYQYNGKPYHFIIYIEDDPNVTQEKTIDFLKTVDNVKNERSVLELVVIMQSCAADLYYGVAAISSGVERCEG